MIMCKKLHFFLFITLVFSGFTSCSKHQISPILTDTSCEPPCWHGIVPGNTTKDDLISILDSLPIVNRSSIHEGDQWSVFDERVFFSLATGERAFASILDGKVKVLMFTKSPTTNLGITLQDVIDRYGAPETVLNDGVPMAGRGLLIDYPQKGISLDLGSIENRWIEFLFIRPKIGPRSKVITIRFFDPKDYEWTYEWLHKKEYAQDYLDARHKWAGYGNIEAKYPVPEINH